MDAHTFDLMYVQVRREVIKFSGGSIAGSICFSDSAITKFLETSNV